MTAQTLLTATAAVVATAVHVGATGIGRLDVIGLLALGTGIQNATVRRLAVPDLTTSVLTMTLTGLAADSAFAGGSHPRRSLRLGSAAAMLAGAVIGGVLVQRSGIVATLILLTAWLAAVAGGFARFTPGVDLPPRGPLG